MVSRTTGPEVLQVFHRCICVQTCVWDQPWPHVGLFTALWLDQSIYCTIRCTVMEMWCNNGIMCLVKALLAPNSSSASFPRKDMCWGAPAGSCSLPKQCSQMCVFPLQMEWNIFAAARDKNRWNLGETRFSTRFYSFRLAPPPTPLAEHNELSVLVFETPPVSPVLGMTERSRLGKNCITAGSSPLCKYSYGHACGNVSREMSVTTTSVSSFVVQLASIVPTPAPLNKALFFLRCHPVFHTQRFHPLKLGLNKIYLHLCMQR